MPTEYLHKYLSLYSTTSSSFGTGTSETITLASVTGVPTDTPVVLTFDRVDSQGVLTPSKMERILGTISGSNLSITTRGVDGTTEQAHTSPVVEMIWNAYDWNEAVDAILTEHNQDGTHGTLVAPTLQTPKINTSINDTNGNEVIKTPATTSAVNEITVTNGATGVSPQISATGGDSNVSLKLAGKNAFITAVGEFDNGNSGTSKAIDWDNGDRQLLTLTGNVTLTYSNAIKGQTLTLRLVQDGTGGRTVTLPTSLWPGGIAGTFGTTIAHTDLLIVYFDGTNYLTQLSADFA